MSFTTTSSSSSTTTTPGRQTVMMMALSGNLLMGTGFIHSAFGLIVPELRHPLLRIGADWSVTPQQPNNDTLSADRIIQEQYQRECAFWFQFGGVMMMTQGYLLRHYCLAIGQGPPKWFGWYMTILGLLGVSVMPASGFGLVLAQGMWILLMPAIRSIWVCFINCDVGSMKKSDQQ